MRWVSGGVAASLLLATVAGCAIGPVAEPAPPVKGVVDAHNRRVELLRRVAASGTLEFTWVDEDGDRHREPGVDARLWLDLPDRVALRASKLGEDLFWLGCDAERYWIFDLVAEASQLIVNAQDTPVGAGDTLLMRPRDLVGLVGLVPVPPDALAAATWDGDRVAWRIRLESSGDGTTTELWIGGSGEAVAAEIIDALGATVFTATMRRYASVDVSGVSKAALPKFPTLIDIESRDGDFSIKLGLDTPTEPDDRFERQLRNVCDLALLAQRLQPVHVVGDRAPP